MVPKGDDAENTPILQSAQDAMISSRMARSVRSQRSTRGRLLNTPTTSQPVQETMIVREVQTVPKRLQSNTTYQNEIRVKINVDLPYSSALTALKAYIGIHGDLIIPRRFIVPSNATYPTEWHGVDLSSTVYTMRWWKRHIKNRSERVSELNQLGFVWQRLQPEWNLVLEALVTFQSIYNHVRVPLKFVVPRGDAQWSRATWGLSLGSCVYRMRARNDFLRGHNSGSRRDQLDGLGFVWDVDDFRFRKFYSALRHYAMTEQAGPFSKTGEKKVLKIPSKFVIPPNEKWPPVLWGYPLGDKCTAVRQKELYIKNKPRRRVILAELGFRFTGNADLGWLKVVHAAAIYSRRNGRNLDVPLKFVVPDRPRHLSQGDWPWPDYLSGLPLGQRLKDVRVRGAYLSGENGDERRRQLDALGMNWKPKRGRRKSSM